MAGDVAPDEPVEVGAAPNRLVARYLAEISAPLPGPARRHRELMMELRDGLTDAIVHYREHGQSSENAAARAVRDSGPAEVVAAAYASLIRLRQARRTAFALLVSGPAIGLAWLVTLTPGQTPDALLLRVPPLALLVFIAATAAVTTLLTTGSHQRWLPRSAHLPHRAAFAACLATVLCDVTILAVAVSWWLGGPSGHPAALIIAAVASSARLCLTQRAARQHLSAARAG